MMVIDIVGLQLKRLSPPESPQLATDATPQKVRPELRTDILDGEGHSCPDLGDGR